MTTSIASIPWSAGVRRMILQAVCLLVTVLPCWGLDIVPGTIDEDRPVLLSPSGAAALRGDRERIERAAQGVLTASATIFALAGTVVSGASHLPVVGDVVQDDLLAHWGRSLMLAPSRMVAEGPYQVRKADAILQGLGLGPRAASIAASSSLESICAILHAVTDPNLLDNVFESPDAKAIRK